MNRLTKYIRGLRGNGADEKNPQIGSLEEGVPDDTSQRSCSTDSDWIVVNYKNEPNDDPEEGCSDSHSNPAKFKPSPDASVIIILGPNKALRQVLISEIPHHCLLLQQALIRNPRARKIAVQSLDYVEFTAYIHRAGSLSKLKSDSLRKEGWMDIVRLGIAAEQLKDIPVQTYVWEALAEKAERSGKNHNMFAAVDLQYVYNKTKIESGLRHSLVSIGIESPALMESIYSPLAFFAEMRVELLKQGDLTTKHPRVTQQWISAKLKVINDMRRCDEDSTSSEGTPSEADPGTPKPVLPSKKPATSSVIERPFSSKPLLAEVITLPDTKSASPALHDPEPALREGLRSDDYRHSSAKIRKTTHPASQDSPSAASPSSQRDGTLTFTTNQNIWTPRPGRLASINRRGTEAMQRPVRQPLVGPSDEDLRKPAGASRNFQWKR